MSRSLPPLNALRAFEAAGRHESFTRAAEELRVSHSAISRHVRGLEDRLGAQLFRDAAPGIALTQTGRAYLAQITPALDLIAEATEDVHATPEGQVLVNSDSTFAHEVILPQLTAFSETHPEIDLRLVASPVLADMDRYEADLAVRFAHRGTLDRPSDLLSDAPLFPYAVPGLLPPKPAIDQILSQRLLRDRMGMDTWPTWAKAAGWTGPLPEQMAFRMKDTLSLRAALHGYGVFLTSAECVNLYCRKGDLVRLSDVGFQLGAYRLVSQEGAHRRKAVRIVRDWLLSITSHFRTAFWEIDQPIG